MMEMAADESVMAVRMLKRLPYLVEKQIGETTITFDVAVPYSIASDGKIQTIEIQRTSTTC